MSENEFGLPQVEETVADSISGAEQVDETPVEPKVKLTYEELEAEVAKTRREAARNRIGKNEEREKAEKYDELMKAQMSELDREKAEKAEIRAELAKLHLEKAQDRVAKKAGLDPDLADRIKGNTEAEMLADAKALAAKAPAKAAAPTARELRPGVQGTPVGTDADVSGDAWLRSALRGK